MGNAFHPGVVSSWEEHEERLISKTGAIKELKGFYRIRPMGGGRLLQSFLCRSPSGHPVVLKIFPKKENLLLDLKHETQELDRLRSKLRAERNVSPMCIVKNTGKGLYLCRQYYKRSLYDRMLCLPRLTLEEKRYYCYQLLRAVKRCHRLGICHGDINSENVMVTSWGWIVLCDFANHKPGVLYADDPAQYDFWFQTTERSRSYIAPERFCERDEDSLAKTSEHVITEGIPRATRLEQPADIFSLGCVLAELYLDGEVVFTRERLMQFRKGQFEPAATLRRIRVPKAQDMINNMLHLDWRYRRSAEGYLRSERGNFFPRSFQYLYALMSGMLRRGMESPDTRLLYLAVKSRAILRELAVGDNVANISLGASLKSLEKTIKEMTGDTDNLDHATRRLRILSRIPPPPPRTSSRKGGDTVPRGESAIGVVVSVVVAILPLAKMPQSRCVGLRLIVTLSAYLSPSMVADSSLPVLVTLTKDPDSSVRCAAIRTITRLLEMLSSRIHSTLTRQSDPNPTTNLSPSLFSRNLCGDSGWEAPQLFTKYLFPELSKLLSDPVEEVRVVYAHAIASLAASATAYHNSWLQYLSTRGGEGRGGQRQLECDQGSQEKAHKRSPLCRCRFNKFKRRSHRIAEEEVKDLASDAAAGLLFRVGAAREKRAIIDNINQLMKSVGQKRVISRILRALVPPLNDPDWQLRACVLRRTLGVSVKVGSIGSNSVLLPCLISALSNGSETVVFEAVSAATALIKLRMFKGLGLVSGVTHAVGPLLCHPSPCLRHVSLQFLHAVGTNVDPAVALSVVRPEIDPFLRPGFKLLSLTRRCIRAILRPPLTEAQHRICKCVAPGQEVERELAKSLKEPESRPPSRFAKRMSQYLFEAAARYRPHALASVSRRHLPWNAFLSPSAPATHFSDDPTAMILGRVETGDTDAIGLVVPAVTVVETSSPLENSSWDHIQSVLHGHSQINTKFNVDTSPKDLLIPPAPHDTPPGIPEEAESLLLLSNESRALSELLHSLALADTAKHSRATEIVHRLILGECGLPAASDGKDGKKRSGRTSPPSKTRADEHSSMRDTRALSFNFAPGVRERREGPGHRLLKLGYKPKSERVLDISRDVANGSSSLTGAVAVKLSEYVRQALRIRGHVYESIHATRSATDTNASQNRTTHSLAAKSRCGLSSGELGGSVSSGGLGSFGFTRVDAEDRCWEYGMDAARPCAYAWGFLDRHGISASSCTASHKGAVNVLDCDPFDRFFVSGGADGYARVWRGVNTVKSPEMVQDSKDRGRGFGGKNTRIIPGWSGEIRCEVSQRLGAYEKDEVTALAATISSSPPNVPTVSFVATNPGSMFSTAC